MDIGCSKVATTKKYKSLGIILIQLFQNLVIRTSNTEEQYLDIMSLNKTHVLGSTQILFKSYLLFYLSSTSECYLLTNKWRET